MFSTLKLTTVALALSACVLVGTAWVRMQDAGSVDPKSANPKIDKLKLLPGFRAEHLYSPSDNKQGSWVSMTFDNKGRLITSDQYGAMYRLELPPIGATSSKPKIEPLIIKPDPTDTVKAKISMGYAQGLLWAFNSLYVMVNHREDKSFPKGSGLYRLQDTDGDDQFDKVTLLKAMKGEGEHGPHSVVLAPDKKSLYVIAGNHTDLPTMDAYRLPNVWQEDNLFPQIKDPRGHAADRKAPGGWIAQVDSLGKHWELVSAGFRNPFDIAFNEAGDMFTYDSDMEWDFGLPWYRPTRICHATSGSEFGWRTGNGKWSPAFPDNLPPVLNIGQGSPTNLMSGQNARFPQKYRQSLFAFDWSFGIIYAVNLKPNGASYIGEREEFISGSPLPLTDGAIGPDGSFYFMTGGRNLESDLYRVYYDGPESTAPVMASAPTAEQQLRKRLEQFHGAPNVGALAAAWPNLNHPDRFVRYAARIAVEHQPVAEWQDRALTEKDPQRLIEGMIALAHHGAITQRDAMLNALLSINAKQLTESKQVDLWRAFEVIFTRMGIPEGVIRSKVIAYVNPYFPATNALPNRSLSKLLISLEAPGVVAKTLTLLALKEEPGTATVNGEGATNSADLILRNPQYGLDIAGMLEKIPPAQQTYYATMLSRLKTGWTPAQRATYFKWFAKAFSYRGGNSYIGFVDRARKLALANVPKDQLAYYGKLSGEELLTSSGNDLVKSYTPKGPGKNWKLDNALAALDTAMTNPDYERGKMIFSAIICSRCHAMRGEGGAVGPELTQLGNRFSKKDILEAIISPDKAISDQYASTIFTLKNGQSVLGRLISEDNTSYSISQNPFAADDLRKIPKKDVVNTKYSTVSIMLPGLINSLNPRELGDLMAYLMAGGNEKHSLYPSGKAQK